jgi:hypothetical protein
MVSVAAVLVARALQVEATGKVQKRVLEALLAVVVVVQSIVVSRGCIPSSGRNSLY